MRFGAEKSAPTVCKLPYPILSYCSAPCLTATSGIFPPLYALTEMSAIR